MNDYRSMMLFETLLQSLAATDQRFERCKTRWGGPELLERIGGSCGMNVASLLRLRPVLRVRGRYTARANITFTRYRTYIDEESGTGMYRMDEEWAGHSVVVVLSLEA